MRAQTSHPRTRHLKKGDSTPRVFLSGYVLCQGSDVKYAWVKDCNEWSSNTLF
jgi:hypothetical protein